jgi:hypothetical protein
MYVLALIQITLVRFLWKKKGSYNKKTFLVMLVKSQGFQTFSGSLVRNLSLFTKAAVWLTRIVFCLSVLVP